MTPHRRHARPCRLRRTKPEEGGLRDIGPFLCDESVGAECVCVYSGADFGVPACAGRVACAARVRDACGEKSLSHTHCQARRGGDGRDVEHHKRKLLIPGTPSPVGVFDATRCKRPGARARVRLFMPTRRQSHKALDFVGPDDRRPPIMPPLRSPRAVSVVP